MQHTVTTYYVVAVRYLSCRYNLSWLVWPGEKFFYCTVKEPEEGLTAAVRNITTPVIESSRDANWKVFYVRT